MQSEAGMENQKPEYYEAQRLARGWGWGHGEEGVSGSCPRESVSLEALVTYGGHFIVE